MPEPLAHVPVEDEISDDSSPNLVDSSDSEAEQVDTGNHSEESEDEEVPVRDIIKEMKSNYMALRAQQRHKRKIKQARQKTEPSTFDNGIIIVGAGVTTCDGVYSGTATYIGSDATADVVGCNTETDATADVVGCSTDTDATIDVVGHNGLTDVGSVVVPGSTPIKAETELVKGEEKTSYTKP